MHEESYISSGESRSKLLTRWWLGTRQCKNAVQIGPEGMPACLEFYVPWWSWPFELLHRLIFGKANLKGN